MKKEHASDEWVRAQIARAESFAIARFEGRGVYTRIKDIKTCAEAIAYAIALGPTRYGRHPIVYAITPEKWSVPVAYSVDQPTEKTDMTTLAGFTRSQLTALYSALTSDTKTRFKNDAFAQATLTKLLAERGVGNGTLAKIVADWEQEDQTRSLTNLAKAIVQRMDAIDGMAGAPMAATVSRLADDLIALTAEPGRAVAVEIAIAAGIEAPPVYAEPTREEEARHELGVTIGVVAPSSSTAFRNGIEIVPEHNGQKVTVVFPARKPGGQAFERVGTITGYEPGKGVRVVLNGKSGDGWYYPLSQVSLLTKSLTIEPAKAKRAPRPPRPRTNPRMAPASVVDEMTVQCAATLAHEPDERKRIARVGDIRSAIDKYLSEDAAARRAGAEKLLSMGVMPPERPTLEITPPAIETKPATTTTPAPQAQESPMFRKKPKSTTKMKSAAKPAAKAKTKREASARPDGLRAESKTATLVDLVSREQGATMAQMLKATGWKRCDQTLKRTLHRIGKALRIKQDGGKEIFFAVTARAK